MTWNDNQQRLWRQPGGRLCKEDLLARMSAGRQQHGPALGLALQGGEGAGIAGQGFGQALEVELAGDVGAMRLDEAAGLQVLGVDQVEKSEEGPSRGRRAGPARGAPGRDAGAQ